MLVSNLAMVACTFPFASSVAIPFHTTGRESEKRKSQSLTVAPNAKSPPSS